MTDRMKMILVAVILYAIAAAVLFGTWVALSYNPPKENGPALANWILATLGALIGHIFTILTGDWTVKDAPAAPGTQGGFGLPPLLLAIAIGAGLLAGCAGLNVSWVATATYNTPATTAATLTPGMPPPAASGAKP